MTFDANGGSTVKAQSMKHGAKATKPGDPTKSGYTFKGWYSDKNLSKAYDFNAAVTGNLTLYAKWDANSYTVTFNTNGGSAVTAQSVKYGAKATRPVDPTRYCYAFTGWYTTATCTAKFDFNTAVKGNVTVYAGWKPAAPTWFWDVDYSDWYGDWATYAATNGLMTGLKDDAGNYTGAFSPSASLTRAMVATVLWRAAGSPSASSAGFPDVKSGAWYADAVNWCARVGIVTGYTGGADQGYFRPDRAVSREELATMVWRFAKHEGVNVANPSTSNFYATTDWRSVSAYAVEPLKWTSAVGLMAGVDYHNGTYGLEPQGTATRAQAAKVFSVLHRDVLTGKVSAHALDEGDVDAGEAAGQAAETAEQQAVPTVTTGVTQEGLAYAIVPEGALDASGAAFELDAEYDELGGRYVGPGAYVTGYAGEKTLLTLPLELGGVPVVSANLSWGEDGGAAQGADVLGADARGNTRLTGVVLQKGCKLVQLDISGNALTGLDLLVLPDEGGLAALRFLDASNSLLTALDVSACPALERLNVSGNRITDAAALSAWVGATGLVADVSGQVVDAAQVPADVPSADEADAPAADQLAADEAGQPEGSELAEDQPAADEPGNPTADVPAADVPAADGSVIGEPAGATTEGAAFAAAVADDAPAPAEAPAA